MIPTLLENMQMNFTACMAATAVVRTISVVSMIMSTIICIIELAKRGATVP